MGVLNVEKSWSRTGSSYGSQDGYTYTATFSEGYQVIHTIDTTEEQILFATGIPRVGDLYPGTFAICKKVGDVSKVGPLMSIVPVEYDGEVGPGGVVDNPLNHRPKYSWTDAVSNEPIDQDVDGKPICTVNGEPLEGVAMEVADLVLTVQRNFALFSPWLTHQYRHSVSSDTFVSFPAGTARLIAFSADSQDAATFSYWSVTAKIQFRLPYATTADKAWHARVCHKGFKVKVGSQIVPAEGGAGMLSTTPVFLKADGTLETNKDNAIWLYFPRYKPLPYNALGLV